MKVILPSFAWFALAAGWACAQSEPQAAAFAPPAELVPVDSVPGGDGAHGDANDSSAQANGNDVFIQRVVAAAGQLPSVQARIRYHTNLFGQQSVGAGVYLQQGLGDERQFRLELKTAIGQQLMTLEQVCDGKFLWQFQDSPDKPKANASDKAAIWRVDLRKVRQALDQDDRNMHVDVAVQMATGGLPKLVSGLQNCFRFDRVEAGQLEALPVWIARGTWQPEALATVSKELAEQAAREQPLNLKLLPQQLPEQVWLYVGQDDLFPYRIEYRRRAGKQGRGGDAGQEAMQPIVTVELYEVRFNAPINPREFVYQPGEADILDTTSNYIKSLNGK